MPASPSGDASRRPRKQAVEVMIRRFDIDATPQGRSIPMRFVEALARFARIPLSVGGGITSLEHIHELLALGVEKVALSVALQRDFSFLQKAADRFGSSTISVVLNVSEPSCPSSELASRWPALVGRFQQCQTAITDLARASEEAGAGELVLNYVQRDGTRALPVAQLAAQPSAHDPTRWPGGCGSDGHIAELLSATPFRGSCR